MTRSGAVVMAVYAFVSFAASGIGTADAQPFTEYPIPTANSGPWGITAGPDGNIWFTELNGNKIGVITTSGTFTEYQIPTTGSASRGIVTGPDGNLWFAELEANKIGTVTPNGVFTEHTIPTPGSKPYLIVTGPDGNLWFTEDAGNKIAKVTTGGSFTEYAVPTPNSGPTGIAVGVDGNIWFAEFYGNKIGKITPAGVITEYLIPTLSATPRFITAGPDGNLWVAENPGKVAKITPDGEFTEFPLPTSSGYPYGITNGPGGKLWFTEDSGNNVGVITVAGDPTEYPIPTGFSQPRSITAGWDGNLWFTEYAGNIIGRFHPTPVAPPPNDECASATALSSPPFSTSVDLTGATDNAADPVRSCSGAVGHNNVWLTFTAASTGMLSVVSTAPLTLYTGACGALVEAACGASGSLSVAITAGQTYVLEVSGPQASYSVTATVCGDGIVSGPSETCDDGNLVNGDGCDDHCHAPPPNDECTSATVLSSPFSTSVDLTGATDNGADPVRSCSGEVGHNNVWYTFTAASSGSLSVVSTAQLTLYTGACGALVEAACGASGSMSVLITAGQTYTLEVSGPEAAYPLTATVCGDGTVSGPSETCDDGNLVNGDGCDDHCLAECPEDLCRCLPNAGKFAVVGQKVTGGVGWFDDEGKSFSGSDIDGSICGITGKLSGRYQFALQLHGDAILTSGVGTRAVGFKGYKIDKLPNPGAYVYGDVATGGGFVKNPQYAAISGATDTSGTDPRVATCQQAMSELATASATLASLAPTQTLGTLVVAPTDFAKITVGPGRQVVNIDSIVLKSNFYDHADLEIVLDPATTVLVVNIAKGLKIGSYSEVFVNRSGANVIFNLTGGSLSLARPAGLGVPVLAPTAKIRALPNFFAAFGGLYTTKAVKLQGAQVAGLHCP